MVRAFLSGRQGAAGRVVDALAAASKVGAAAERPLDPAGDVAALAVRVLVAEQVGAELPFTVRLPLPASSPQG